MRAPEDLLYTKEHEWVSREEGNRVTVGITQHAQKELGEVVFVDLPEKGKSLSAEEVFGSVESVKAVSDLYTPVSGTIQEVNTSLLDAPEKINEDVYGEGWMVRIEMSNPAELDSLMDLPHYEKYLSEEG